MLPQLQPQNSKVRKILFPEFFYGYFADFKNVKLYLFSLPIIQFRLFKTFGPSNCDNFKTA